MESDALAPPPIRSSMIESERLGAPSLPGSAVDSLRASLPSTRIVFAPVSGYGPSLELRADRVGEVAALDLRGDHEEHGGEQHPADQREQHPAQDAAGRDPAAPLGRGLGAGLRRAAERGQLRQARAAAARAVDLVVRAVARLPLIGVLAQLVEA